MDVKILWQGVPKHELNSLILSELQWLGRRPEDLITHTMMLDPSDEDWTGPSLSLHWDTEASAIVAQYSETTEWEHLEPFG